MLWNKTRRHPRSEITRFVNTERAQSIDWMVPTWQLKDRGTSETRVCGSRGTPLPLKIGS